MKEKYYAAFINNDDQRRKSSSGGLAYALCKHMLQSDASVYGVEYSEDFKRARYTKVSEINELYKLNGSKYITTDKQLTNGGGVYNEILNDLSNNKCVVFIGTPCEVSVLYKYLMNKGCNYNKKLFTIDFICQGPVNLKVQGDYIDFLEGKYNSKVVEFSVRYKNPTWQPVYLRAKFENEQEHIRPLYETDFGRAFMIYGQEKCYSCKYKGERHCSDITVGDFWGLNPEDKGFNELGTSVVITHSEYGLKVLEELKDVSLFEHSKDKAIGKNLMYSVSRERHAKLEKFKKEYNMRGLHKAVFKTRSLPSKLKYILQLIMGRKPY